MPDLSINSSLTAPQGLPRGRERFLEALGPLGKVSLATREVGVHPAGCCQERIDAGIDAKKYSRARRAEYFRPRESGVARADATRQTGLSLRTATDEERMEFRCSSVAVNTRTVSFTRPSAAAIPKSDRRRR